VLWSFGRNKDKEKKNVSLKQHVKFRHILMILTLLRTPVPYLREWPGTVSGRLNSQSYAM
jgi:hypothetical protein